MTATTYSSFNQKIESFEVAKSFAEEIRGKTILVTGVNRGGIGFSTSKAFVSTIAFWIFDTNWYVDQASQSPSLLIIAGRNLSRIQENIDALRLEFPKVNYRALKLDLSSQKAVHEAAGELLSWSDVPTLDILVNNAAVMNLPERILSDDGLEMQFATNHVGHFLFTCLIMPKLVKAAEGSPKGATRVINVTSLSPTVAGMRWSDINFEKINKDLPEAE